MYGRGILETHFQCAKCGNELQLEYEHNIKVKASTKSTKVTGADKVEIKVFVAPCEHCLKPAKDIMDAVKILQGV